MNKEEIYDVIIIGGRAAGLTAGIYSSRAKLSTLILNEGAIGGQMVLTEEIANYPGVEKTNGYLLANTMKKQAKEYGCKIKSNLKISRYDLEGETKHITLEDEPFQRIAAEIDEPTRRPQSALDVPRLLVEPGQALPGQQMSVVVGYRRLGPGYRALRIHGCERPFVPHLCLVPGIGFRPSQAVGIRP